MEHMVETVKNQMFQQGKKSRQTGSLPSGTTPYVYI